MDVTQECGVFTSKDASEYYIDRGGGGILFMNILDSPQTEQGGGACSAGHYGHLVFANHSINCQGSHACGPSTTQYHSSTIKVS